MGGEFLRETCCLLWEITSGGSHVPTGTIRSPGAWQRNGRQAHRLAYGGGGATNRRGGAQMGRGSCPNIACMPSKNEIWSAKAAHFVRHAAEFGMTTGPVVIDMAVVRERKRKMV